MPVLKIKKDGIWEELGGTSPMNGGNADTLDGKHASEFATMQAIKELEDVIGGLKISVQNEAPTDVANGSLWVDLDAVSSGISSGGSSSSGFEVALDTTLAKAGYAADAKAVGDAIAEIRRYVDDTIIGGEW